jgi:hypothetical protein
VHGKKSDVGEVGIESQREHEHTMALRLYFVAFSCSGNSPDHDGVACPGARRP